MRVKGTDNDTLGLSGKAILLMASDCNTQPLGRQRATDALVRTCIQDFGYALADLPRGQAFFTHINGYICTLHGLDRNQIRETDLLTIWINGCIPGIQDDPVFVMLAPNLVDQAICLTNPVCALNRNEILTTTLVDNAMHPEKKLVTPCTIPSDNIAILRNSPVQCQRLVRRIEEIGCVSALMGASVAVLDPTTQGLHRDPQQEGGTQQY